MDDIDRNIVRLLRLDARMTNAKLAGAVGLSPSACLRRIKQLEHSGVIRGYTAIVGHTARDDALAVIINISLERQTEDYLSKFELAIRKHPEIQECYLMTGAADYFLRIEVDNAAEFERIHTDVLSTLPGVARIHSSFAIRNVMSGRRRSQSDPKARKSSR